MSELPSLDLCGKVVSVSKQFTFLAGRKLRSRGLPDPQQLSPANGPSAKVLGKASAAWVQMGGG